MEDNRKPIYLCDVDVSYKKGKKRLSSHNKTLTIVTTCDDKRSMTKDKLSMSRIENGIYPPTYKGERLVLVRSVKNCKIVGYVNSSAL